MDCKAWLKFIFIGLFSFSAVACSNENGDTNPLPKEEPKQESSVTQPIKESGVFVGLIDNQTFEVELNGETKSVRFSEDAKALVEQIKEGSLIEMELYEGKNGQLELKMIKAEEMKQEENIEKSIWKFSGIIDTHSVEFMAGSKPLVAQYSPELKSAVENLTKNEETEVHYKKDEFGRIVLIKVEKIQR